LYKNTITNEDLVVMIAEVSVEDLKYDEKTWARIQPERNKNYRIFRRNKVDDFSDLAEEKKTKFIKKLITYLKQLFSHKKITKKEKQAVMEILDTSTIQTPESIASIKQIFNKLTEKEKKAFAKELINDQNQNFAINIETKIRIIYENNESKWQEKDKILSAYTKAMLYNLYEESWEYSETKTEITFPKSLTSTEDYFDPKNTSLAKKDKKILETNISSSEEYFEKK